MSIDEFEKHIKSNKEYQRTSNDAIKTNIQKILNEIKKYCFVSKIYKIYKKILISLNYFLKIPIINISV